MYTTPRCLSFNAANPCINRMPTMDGASLPLSMTRYRIVRRAVLLRNTTALGMDNRSHNTPSNWTINVAVNPVNGHSKYRNAHNSRNRFRYDVSVNATWHSSKNTWANCWLNANPWA